MKKEQKCPKGMVCYMFYLPNDVDYEIVDCVCCWYDLLGFGAPFINAKWNLHNRKSEASIKRIICEAPYFGGPFSSCYSKKLHINDGIISNFDLDKTVPDPIEGLFSFLESVLTDFDALNTVDKRNGFPGVRGVITLGQRVVYDSTNISRLINTQTDMCYHPKEFQMNTAFSKAYIVEESGSKAGISGPFLYIDQELFQLVESYSCSQTTYQIVRNYDCDEVSIVLTANREWLATFVFDINTIPYQSRGIDTIFYRLKSFHTIIDEKAKEMEHQKTLRYINMEDE